MPQPTPQTYPITSVRLKTHQAGAPRAPTRSTARGGCCGATRPTSSRRCSGCRGRCAACRVHTPRACCLLGHTSRLWRVAAKRFPCTCTCARAPVWRSRSALTLFHAHSTPRLDPSALRPRRRQARRHLRLLTSPPSLAPSLAPSSSPSAAPTGTAYPPPLAGEAGVAAALGTGGDGHGWRGPRREPAALPVW